jgi:hypothetical protein
MSEEKRESYGFISGTRFSVADKRTSGANEQITAAA